MSQQGSGSLNSEQRKAKDDGQLGKRQAPALTEDDECLSLQNNTSFGRVKKRKIRHSDKDLTVLDRQTIVLKGSDRWFARQIEACDFFEHSRFVIDTLRNDFCKQRPDGWFEFEELMEPEGLEAEFSLPEAQEAEEAEGAEGLFGEKEEDFKSPKPIQIVTSKDITPAPPRKLQFGRWSSSEHELFLEALRLYGKDWEQIERHVGSRDITNCRAHGQKFLVKLLKFLEGKAAMKEMSIQDARFYYGTLNVKLHKHMKKTRQVFQVGEEKPQKEKSEFKKWAAASRTTNRDYGPSLLVNSVLKQAEDGSRRIQFSFRSIIEDDADSDDSTASRFHHQFNMFPPCTNSTAPEFDHEHRKAMGLAFKNMVDIDSDDENPDLTAVFDDCGFSFNVIRQISAHSTMLLFYHIHIDKYHLTHPGFYKKAMERIKQLMDNAFSGTEACLNVGEICFPLDFKDMEVDLEKAQAYFERPEEEKETAIYFTYTSPKRGWLRGPSHTIRYPMTAQILANLKTLKEQAQK